MFQKKAGVLWLVLTFFLACVVTTPVFAEEPAMCSLCDKEITDSNIKFTIMYADGKVMSYGCPGCGLTVIKQGKGNVKSAKTTDFISRQMLDAKSAYYVLGSDVGFCCDPAWLSFAKKDQAEKFTKGFGGKVMSYEEALAWLADLKKQHHGSDHSGHTGH